MTKCLPVDLELNVLDNRGTLCKCLLLEYEFSRSAERSELLIETEARSAESLEARSAESRSDVAPNARRRAQADANLGQGLYIYFDVCMALNNGADVT